VNDIEFCVPIASSSGFLCVTRTSWSEFCVPRASSSGLHYIKFSIFN